MSSVSNAANSQRELARMVLGLFDSVNQVCHRARVRRAALKDACSVLARVKSCLTLPIMWLQARLPALHSSSSKPDGAGLAEELQALQSVLVGLNRGVQHTLSVFGMFALQNWVLHPSPLLRSQALNAWWKVHFDTLARSSSTLVQVGLFCLVKCLLYSLTVLLVSQICIKCAKLSNDRTVVTGSSAASGCSSFEPVPNKEVSTLELMQNMLAAVSRLEGNSPTFPTDAAADDALDSSFQLIRRIEAARKMGNAGWNSDGSDSQPGANFSADAPVHDAARPPKSSPSRAAGSHTLSSPHGAGSAKLAARNVTSALARVQHLVLTAETADGTSDSSARSSHSSLSACASVLPLLSSTAVSLQREKRLGVGSRATVVMGTFSPESSNNIPVAVKQLHDAGPSSACSVYSLFYEALVMACKQPQHLHVLPLIGIVCETPEQSDSGSSQSLAQQGLGQYKLWLVTRLLPGCSLGQALAAKGDAAFTPVHRLRIALKIAAALAHLHAPYEVPGASGQAWKQLQATLAQIPKAPCVVHHGAINGSHILLGSSDPKGIINGSVEVVLGGFGSATLLLGDSEGVKLAPARAKADSRGGTTRSHSAADVAGPPNTSDIVTLTSGNTSNVPRSATGTSEASGAAAPPRLAADSLSQLGEQSSSPRPNVDAPVQVDDNAAGSATAVATSSDVRNFGAFLVWLLTGSDVTASNSPAGAMHTRHKSGLSLDQQRFVAYPSGTVALVTACLTASPAGGPTMHLALEELSKLCKKPFPSTAHGRARQLPPRAGMPPSPALRAAGRDSPPVQGGRLVKYGTNELNDLDVSASISIGGGTHTLGGLQASPAPSRVATISGRGGFAVEGSAPEEARLSHTARHGALPRRLYRPLMVDARGSLIQAASGDEVWLSPAHLSRSRDTSDVSEGGVDSVVQEASAMPLVRAILELSAAAPLQLGGTGATGSTGARFRLVSPGSPMSPLARLRSFHLRQASLGGFGELQPSDSASPSLHRINSFLSVNSRGAGGGGVGGFYALHEAQGAPDTSTQYTSVLLGAIDVMHTPWQLVGALWSALGVSSPLSYMDQALCGATLGTASGASEGGGATDASPRGNRAAVLGSSLKLHSPARSLDPRVVVHIVRRIGELCARGSLQHRLWRPEYALDRSRRTPHERQTPLVSPMSGSGQLGNRREHSETHEESGGNTDPQPWSGHFPGTADSSGESPVHRLSVPVSPDVVPLGVSIAQPSPVSMGEFKASEGGDSPVASSVASTVQDFVCDSTWQDTEPEGDGPPTVGVEGGVALAPSAASHKRAISDIVSKVPPPGGEACGEDIAGTPCATVLPPSGSIRRPPHHARQRSSCLKRPATFHVAPAVPEMPKYSFLPGHGGVEGGTPSPVMQLLACGVAEALAVTLHSLGAAHEETARWVCYAVRVLCDEGSGLSPAEASALGSVQHRLVRAGVAQQLCAVLSMWGQTSDGVVINGAHALSRMQSTAPSLRPHVMATGVTAVLQRAMELASQQVQRSGHGEDGFMAGDVPMQGMSPGDLMACEVVHACASALHDCARPHTAAPVPHCVAMLGEGAVTVAVRATSRLVQRSRQVQWTMETVSRRMLQLRQGHGEALRRGVASIASQRFTSMQHAMQALNQLTGTLNDALHELLCLCTQLAHHAPLIPHMLAVDLPAVLHGVIATCTVRSGRVAIAAARAVAALVACDLQHAGRAWQMDAQRGTMATAVRGTRDGFSPSVVLLRRGLVKGGSRNDLHREQPLLGQPLKRGSSAAMTPQQSKAVSEVQQELLDDVTVEGGAAAVGRGGPRFTSDASGYSASGTSVSTGRGNSTHGTSAEPERSTNSTESSKGAGAARQQQQQGAGAGTALAAAEEGGPPAAGALGYASAVREAQAALLAVDVHEQLCAMLQDLSQGGYGSVSATVTIALYWLAWESAPAQAALIAYQTEEHVNAAHASLPSHSAAEHTMYEYGGALVTMLRCSPARSQGGCVCCTIQ